MLTVGGTSNDAKKLWYRSSGSEPSYCWEDPPGHTGDVNDRIKPEIVAPAQNVSTYFFNGSGVSASTPMVAGIAAALLDQRPSLLNFPEQMKAVLLAGSHARHSLTPGGSRSISAEGLGTASAKWASRVAEKRHEDRHRKLRRDDLHGHRRRRLPEDTAVPDDPFPRCRTRPARCAS